jgi:hypothetical protein
MMATTMPLGYFAHARSGDKGAHANIGVVAFSDVGYEYLRKELTAERVLEFFRPLGPTGVDRYELPLVGALNFVLYNVLGGGASESLRIDSQGKLLGTAILELALPAPNDPALIREARSA